MAPRAFNLNGLNNNLIDVLIKNKNIFAEFHLSLAFC